jgi:hypothetical protein
MLCVCSISNDDTDLTTTILNWWLHGMWWTLGVFHSTNGCLWYVLYIWSISWWSFQTRMVHTNIYWVICFFVLSTIRCTILWFTFLRKCQSTPESIAYLHVWLMNRFGLLQNHWCRCYESKNAHIKSHKTLQSIRHQRWLSYHLSVHLAT